MIRASVVVPAHNAERTLPECLHALCAQDLRKNEFEIVIVDDGSNDSTAIIARSFSARVIRRRQGGAGAARNTGLRAALGEWVAFTDADCIPTRSWLRLLVQAATAQATPAPLVGAAGKTLGFESNTDAARFCDLAGSLDAQRHLSHPKFPFAPSANLMYRRSVLEEVGGFDERYISYEACDLHWRIMHNNSGSFVYEPRAVVLHRHRADWKAFWRQQYSYGIGFSQFVMHHPGACRWTLADELREWGEIGRFGFAAWRAPTSDALLYRRGMFVKKFAQRLGFIKAQLDFKERLRW